MTTLEAYEVVRGRLGEEADCRELGVSCATAVGLEPRDKFRGLSDDDGLLLSEFLAYLGPGVLEIHTHVGCGMGDADARGHDVAISRGSYVEMYARRADAVVLTRARWLVCECKESLGHKAIGQCLFYRHHLPLVSAELVGIEAVVVCLEADRDFVAVADSVGVGVAVVGGDGAGAGRVSWRRPGAR